MANQSIGVPRIYIDYTQLAKAKGYWKNLNDYDINNTRGVYELDAIGNEIYGDKNMNVWNFDYANPTQYTHRGGQNSFNFRLGFWNPQNASEYSFDWAKLMSTTRWAGIINHNLNTSFRLGGNSYISGQFWNGDLSNELYIDLDKTDSINGASSVGTAYGIANNGYSIITGDLLNELYDSSNNSQSDRYSTFILTVVLGEIGESYPPTDFNIGSIGFGNYIDLVAPDLNLIKSISYEGVKRQRSLSGADYTNINYLGAPDWLNGQPWTLSNEDSSKARVGKNGRRSWNIKFSYLSNDDLFYDISQSNIAGTTGFNTDGIENNFTAGSEIQLLWDLTLGGSLPFIFCPDKDATDPEFCVARFKDSVLKAEQVAYQTWNLSITVEECW